ncbi:hypothetical protein AALD22_25500 [Lachnospiraceae bacterium 56-18]|jgi:phosphoribosyl 1,2-cyclic phosphate phosphodiesterase
MNVIILGSGGCVSTPRACCNCRVCTEARQKGFPYARTGCSLFVEDVNLLIDTPEDINASLNNSGIQKVEHILYSHCDPDHTMGMRVVEQLKMDWLANSLGKKPDNPIEVASLPAILTDIKKQGTKYGSAIKYYEASGLIYTKEIRAFKKDNILIELVPVDEQEHVAIRKQYGIKRVIITHLEEDWGKSYNDYRELERELNLIHFAYDGLKIQL